jgi:hypothetical protein
MASEARRDVNLDDGRDWLRPAVINAAAFTGANDHRSKSVTGILIPQTRE